MPRLVRSTALIAAGLVLVVVAVVQLTGRHPSHAAALAAPNWGDPRSVGQGSIAAPGPSKPARSGAATAALGPPQAGSVLTVAGRRAPIIPVTVSRGVMNVPADPGTLGWWSGGAVPGAATGSAVIVGHVNYAGVTGPLAVLPQLRAGAEVTISEPGARLRYRISAVRSYPKAVGLPAAAFDRDGPPRLVLITCGGGFDSATGNYLDNVVAYAQPE